MHFCAVAARVYGRFSRPRKTSLNWFIPALVKRRVGSSCGTSGELGTTRWPCRSKYCRKERRISWALIIMNGVLQAVPDGRVHAAGVKSLSQQIAVNASRHGGFLDRRAVAQLAVERLRDQRVLVDFVERFGHRSPGDPAVDAERLDGAERAQPAMALHVRLGPGAGERRATVVQRPFRQQPRDRRVHLVGVELAAREPRPHLRLRQLAAGEQPEGGDVGVRHASNYLVTLVIV